MKQKRLFIFLIVEGILFLGLSLGYNIQFTGIFSYISIPFVEFGKGLRMLSLHSSFGNAVAIFCYTIVCALPLVYLGYRLLRKKARAEDTLLLLMAAVLAYITYYFVNPSLILNLEEMLKKKNMTSKEKRIPRKKELRQHNILSY